MTESHTPGPWVIGPECTTIYHPERIGMLNTTRKIFDVETGLEPRLRDAYLIAASPDMLEALLYISRLWDNSEPIEESDIEIVKKAIAKAKGRDL